MMLKVDQTTEMMVRMLVDHQKTKPTFLYPDSPNPYEILEMNEWVRMDDALRLMIGVRLSAQILEEATNG